MNAVGFSNILAVARKKKGLTQNDVCRVIGISDVSTVSNWETGKSLPSLETVIELSRAYEDPMVFQLYLEAKGTDDLLPYRYKDKEVLHTNDLRVIGMHVQKEYNDVAQEMPRLINILYDGVIDSEERGDYENFIQQAKELIGVLVPLILRDEIQKKKALQDCNLEKAYA